MIEFVKKNVDNGEGASCKNCIWYEPEDMSVGQWGGCIHEVMFDDEGNVIESISKAIDKCMADPRHCCLMDDSEKTKNELYRVKQELSKLQKDYKELQNKINNK